MPALVLSCARDVIFALESRSSESSGSSGFSSLLETPGSTGSVGSWGIGTPLPLILKVGKPGIFTQAPQPITDLNRPEQPGLTGSSVLPPSPPNTIPSCLPRYHTGNMVPLITVVVSEVHDGFEAVEVLKSAGGNVIVVPFPLFLAAVDTGDD